MTFPFRILVLASLLFTLTAHAAGPSPGDAVEQGGAFDHEKKTGYPLLGKHKNLKCASCHKDGQYGDKPAADCASCHANDNTHRGRFDRKCDDCHSQKNWKDIRFDHDAQTRFPLVDSHKGIACTACHRDGPFRVRSACFSCHQKDDKHKGEQGQACGNCHNQKAWSAAQFDHDAKTSFPLAGKHKGLQCTDCHKDGQYTTPLQSNCAACHQKNDIHKGDLGQQCETCHAETSWKESLFDHAKQTGVALPGKHRDASCLGCHRAGRFKSKVPNLCVYCHVKDDAHKRMFGALCSNCHNEQSWQSTFTHVESMTRFPLSGKHQNVKCEGCHKGRLYVTKPPHECYSCHHQTDKHKGQFGQQCEKCHDEQGWNDTFLK